MPPKAKFTREQVVQAALDIVRASGKSALSARALAAKLGTSPQPIFRYFKSMDELICAVTGEAKNLYKQYFTEGLAETPAFKGIGMKYIQFAKDEPELFRMLFMAGDKEPELSHFLPQIDENSPQALSALQTSYGISEERARRLYNHLSIYTHGLAVLYAQGRNVFSTEDVSGMLTEVFTALMKAEKS